MSAVTTTPISINRLVDICRYLYRYIADTDRMQNYINVRLKAIIEKTRAIKDGEERQEGSTERRQKPKVVNF